MHPFLVRAHRSALQREAAAQLRGVAYVRTTGIYSGESQNQLTCSDLLVDLFVSLLLTNGAYSSF